MSAYDAPAAYDDEYDRPLSGRQVALIDLLDRLLSGGVVLTGDVVLSIADIDLVRISLRAVIVSVREQMEEQWAPILPPATNADPARTDPAHTYPAHSDPDPAYTEGRGHGADAL
ncbi:gas vesicle protein [Streptomyces ossamyceticus]|uniref:gas vesicle protein n=1 Tax=Streptomyces ossamyceticus TaxID=249581 RepID=UPI0039C91CC5